MKVLDDAARRTAARRNVISILEIYDLKTRKRDVVGEFDHPYCSQLPAWLVP